MLQQVGVDESLSSRERLLLNNVCAAAICRVAQDVMSSQCKQLFREAVDDSKTGNLTTVAALDILKAEEADNPRPSSGCASARLSSAPFQSESI